MSSTKKIIEIAKMPIPISLAKKKQKNTNQVTPYKIGLQPSALQSIENNCKSSNHKLISNMKEQLSAIKTNVQKLIVNQISQNKEDRNKIIYDELNQQSVNNKNNQERLRTKQRGQGELRVISQNEKEKMISQKQKLMEKVRKLEQQGKIMNIEIEKYKNDRKNIIFEYKKLKEQLKQKTEQDYNEIRKHYNINLKNLQQKLDIQDKQKNQLIQKLKNYEFEIHNYKKQSKSQKYDKLLLMLQSKQQIIHNLKRNQDSLKSKIQSISFQIIEQQKTIKQLTNNLNKQHQYKIKLQNQILELKDQQKIINIEKQLSDLRSKQISNIKNNPIAPEIIKLRNYNLELQQKNKNLVYRVGELQSFQKQNHFEKKIKQLLVQKQNIIQDYQIKLLKLENQIQEQKERYFIEKMSIDIKSNQLPTNMDECVKKILKQNEELRNVIKQKSQEIFELKNNFEHSKRKNEQLKQEIQIQKLKLITLQKNKKSNYQISIQNITNELDSQIRKNNTLQNRINLKINEIKKKDDFIKNIIMGKISKTEDQNQINYMKKQLEYYFSADYQQRLFYANERIKQLERINMEKI